MSACQVFPAPPLLPCHPVWSPPLRLSMGLPQTALLSRPLGRRARLRSLLSPPLLHSLLWRSCRRVNGPSPPRLLLRAPLAAPLPRFPWRSGPSWLSWYGRTQAWVTSCHGLLSVWWWATCRRPYLKPRPLWSRFSSRWWRARSDLFSSHHDSASRSLASLKENTSVA